MFKQILLTSFFFSASCPLPPHLLVAGWGGGKPALLEAHPGGRRQRAEKGDSLGTICKGGGGIMQGLEVEHPAEPRRNK